MALGNSSSSPSCVPLWANQANQIPWINWVTCCSLGWAYKSSPSWPPGYFLLVQQSLVQQTQLRYECRRQTGSKNLFILSLSRIDLSHSFLLLMWCRSCISALGKAGLMAAAPQIQEYWFPTGDHSPIHTPSSKAGFSTILALWTR